MFVRQGYGSTNVQHIADQAGISIGLLYRHYKTMDQLFEELTRFADEVYLDLSSSDDLAHLLLLMTQSFFSTVTKGQQAVLKQINSDLLQTTAELIAKGQRQGKFREGDAGGEIFDAVEIALDLNI
ncbi:hypothetical protein J40TS1_35590 [Paenibacillus montaniterrae]|uniref:HTH tetR-type domain-containing protein n=1 Tax=Paenibacillus montaniterrae TaxID=429341 RepID=A0A920CVA8_9BACL|nr:helix-turn-helix domain-containing protein [Paenibacillus montaniterrae]GIP17917.1 hypothetical protein J40TS1_35590 [Paenibacillus montaniterrae]